MKTLTFLFLAVAAYLIAGCAVTSDVLRAADTTARAYYTQPAATPVPAR